MTLPQITMLALSLGIFVVLTVVYLTDNKDKKQ